ncbi:hypothetical protein D6829_01335 [Candidatus Pacearchaeota archaeon]|nr:MAG: hypothetical protein D6829_01335 [Candidatus Pacearchaeota archaeon]
MAGTIDMKLMRYINLLSKVSGVRTTKCFLYNNQIVFAVPKNLVSKAIGKGAENVRKLKSILGKRIKIVSIPSSNSREEISRFVESIVEPVEFNMLNINNGVLTISANRQSKAALIGRNRVREKELFEILKNSFNIREFKIV